MKKYKLVKSDIPHLYRIKACCNILLNGCIIRKGTLGGYVSGESNLSQEGVCWIFNNARVVDNARVEDDATVFDNALLSNNARVCDKASVKEDAKIKDFAVVKGHACVSGKAILCLGALIQDKACVSGDSILEDYAVANNEAKVYGGLFENKTTLSFGAAYDNSVYTLLRCSVGLAVINDEVIAYKYVIKNDKEKYFRSLYDYNFKYEMNKCATVPNPDMSNESCTTGLHCGNMTYWERGVLKPNVCNIVLLQVKVKVKDIITIQEGKIRCKKLKVIGVVKNDVFLRANPINLSN